MPGRRTAKQGAGDTAAWLAGWLAAHAAEIRRAWLAGLPAAGTPACGTPIARDAARLQRAWSRHLVAALAGAIPPEGPAGAWRALEGCTVEASAAMLLALRTACRERLAAEADAGDTSAREALGAFDHAADAATARAIAGGAAGRERLQRERRHNELLRRVIAAQEDERKRVARELHDQTGQWLTSLMIGLRRLEAMQCRDEGRAAVAEMIRNAGRALDEIHHLAYELRPSVLDDLGIAAALQRYAEDFERRAGIHLELELDALAGVRLDPALEIALYRIVQEALTNVAKHAHARNASVLLQSRADSLLLIVEDDGRGFIVPDARVSNGKHYGLMGMQERVNLIGGKLTIESSPGAGTTIYVELPKPARQEGPSEGNSVSAPMRPGSS